VDRSDVEQKLRRALKPVAEKDRELTERDANERSISHKLAEYLQREFCDWHVDCEYNREGHKPKRLTVPECPGQTSPSDIYARTIYPDIIVHRRGRRKNLLVIEVKKEGNPVGAECDKKKLEAFRQELGYEHAALITFQAHNAAEPYSLEWVDRLPGQRAR
jgi:hypothetical protein